MKFYKWSGTMKIKLAAAFSITVLVAIVLLAASSPSGFLGSDDFGMIVFFVFCGILALLYWAMRNMEAAQRIRRACSTTANSRHAGNLAPTGEAIPGCK